MFLFAMGCGAYIGIESESFGRKDSLKKIEFCPDASDVMSEFSDK